MATTTADTQAPRKTISGDNERVGRLTVETAKFLGVGVGETVPVSEVRKQAHANGYDDDETADLLADSGLLGADRVVVPPQADFFGSLWRIEDGESLAGPEIKDGVEDGDDVDPTLARFRDWLESKSDKGATGHSYTFKNARKRYARACDVDRWYVQNTDEFSTVFITYCAHPQQGEILADHASRFFHSSVRRKTRRVLKSLGVWDKSSGARVLSPKPADSDRVPWPNSTITHGHTFLWLPGEASRADFEGLIDLHIDRVTGATGELHPIEDSVKVWTHDSEDVTSPPGVGDGRPPTTALPHELGNNLPLNRARFDSRGLARYSETWCANLRLGTDDTLDSRGIQRFRPFGEFGDLADRMHDGRTYSDD